MSLTSIEPATITAPATLNTSSANEIKSNETQIATAILPYSGEIIFKPAASNAISIFNPITVENFSTYGKPNAIVRPVIRKNESTDEMTLPHTIEPNHPASEQSNIAFKQDYSSGRFRKKEIDTFARELDIKLKYLQKDKKTTSKNVMIFHFLHFFFYLKTKSFHAFFNLIIQNKFVCM